MNVREDCNIVNPFGGTSACSKFTIDDVTNPFILRNITVVKQHYTLSFYAKADAESILTIQGITINVSTTWERYILLFTAESTNLNFIFGTGVFYLYKPKLEIGNKATDWTPAPEDLATGEELEGVQDDLDNTKLDLKDARTLIEKNAEDIILRATVEEFNKLTKRVGEAELKLTAEGITSIVGTTFAKTTDVDKKFEDVSTTIQQTSKDLTVKIDDAAKTATNFLKYDGGLIVGEIPQAESEVLGNNVLITPTGVDIRNGNTVLASYKADKICLGNSDGYNTYIDSSGLKIKKGATTLGNFTASSLILGDGDGSNVKISDEGLFLRNGATPVASFTDGCINLGKTNASAGFDTIINMLSGKLKIASNSYGDGTNYIKSPELDLNIYASVLTLSCADEYTVDGVDPQIRLFANGAIDMNASNISINGNIAFGLYSPNMNIHSCGKSSSWIAGRDNAMLRLTRGSNDEYRTILSMKMTNTSWEIGAYNHVNWHNDLIFTCISDDNYSSGTNSAERQIRFHPTGYVKGLIGCDDDWNVTGYSRTEQNFVCLGSGHGLYGTHTDGNTRMRIAVAKTSNAGTSGDAVNCTIHGDGSYRTYVVGASLYHNQTWNKYSDRRLKTNFADLDDRYLDLFDSLSPVLYNLKTNLDKHKDIGYIAQDVLRIMIDSGISENENAIINRCSNPDDADLEEILTLDYNGLSIVTTYALQDTRKRLKEAEEEIQKLKQLLQTS